MSFYDPQGVHLRTYSDNHLRPVDSSGNPYVNFAFDTLSQELLQDGTFNVDDDIHRYRNGFVFGEGDPAMRTSPTTGGVQSGLAFWSRPADNKTPHLHVDDWNNAKRASSAFQSDTAVTRAHSLRTPRPPTRSMEERSGLHTTRRTRAGP